MSRRARRAGPPGRTRKKSLAPELQITTSEDDGVRYLHFGNEWIQGAMRVRKPWTLELDYSRHMMAWLLFESNPERILQLGLGAGSLTRFTRKFFPTTELDVVDNSEAVWVAAQSLFRLPPNDDFLEVAIADGQDFIEQSHRHGMYDVAQVDVFDDQVRGPVLDSQRFYDSCANVLTSQGVLVVNLFGKQSTSYQENLKRIERAFDNQVLLLPPVEAGNIIVLASKTAFDLDWSGLYERAKEIQSHCQLNARGWVNGIKSMQEGD
jgi:spermidine synthase